MKKHLPFLMCLGMLTYGGAAAQSFTVKDLDFETQHGDVSAIDIDKDGDLDLLIMGEMDATTRQVQLFLNDGSGNFAKTASPFLPGAFSTIDWGDVDGDGNLDMVQSGFVENRSFAALFKSNASGVFTQQTTPALPQAAPGIGLADLNNDGYQDIYVFGNANALPNNAVRAKIFFNNKQGGFTESNQFEDFRFIDPEISVVDFDTDGDFDLFVNGFEEVSGSRFSKMFVNTNGTFAVRDLGLIQKGFGSATWGDYDGDGDLDLLLNGDGGANDEASSDIYRLYRNNNGAFAEATTFTMYRQIAVGDGGRFADWDNDGDLDVIVTGWNGSRQATAIYLNNAGTFTAMANNDRLPGVSESSIEVADVDGDSDLDLLLTGFSGNSYGENLAFNRKVSLVVVNPTTMVNLAPTMPLNLIATAEAGGAITFTWDEATDATTPRRALTYNLFLVNLTTGMHHAVAMADTTTGKLMLQRMGNVQQNTMWTLRDLPNGRYRVGVQAIDNSYMGSAFSKVSFTNTNGVLTALAEGKSKLGMSVYPNPSKGALQVQFESGKKHNVTITTIDGRTIKTLSVNGESALHLPAGAYFLQATDANGARETRKIIVQ